MNREFGRVGFSLTWKLFLATAGIILVLLGATIAWTWYRSVAIARTSIGTALGQTRASFARFQDDQFGKLRSAVTLAANDPAFKSALRETAGVGDAEARATLLDRAQEHQKDIGSEMLVYLDAEGVVQARTDKPQEAGRSWGERPNVQKALSGEAAEGIGRQEEALVYTVTVPVLLDQLLIGAIMAGKRIDERVATDLEASTQSDAAFVSFDPRETAATSFGLAPIATTLGAAGGDLIEALKAQRPLLQHLAPEGKPQGPVELTLAGEQYIAILEPIRTSSEQVVGAYVGLRSLSREMAVFERILQSLLIAGIAALILAFLAATLLARRLTSPIRALVAATEHIKQGQYEKVEVPERSSDEIGVLARAFKSMVAELVEKAEMEKYLAEITAQAPVVAGVDEPAGAMTQARGMTAGALGMIAPGTVIGDRYEIESVLGQGGMGMVFKAKDRSLDEIVALKMLREDAASADPTANDRFKQEIKLARRITHKNVLRTYDFGELSGYKYITMEFVRGNTVKGLIQNNPDSGLPMGAALRISKQLCSALAAAHEVGVIHRDVKPQNMLLDPTGELKIMDFGISRLAGNKGLTMTGMVMGTPDYMSPEQAQGKDNDHRADVYSTGIVMYELFTGKLPFIAENPLTVVLMHVQEKPRPPRELNPKIPAALEAIIMKCLEKNPAGRYQSMAEVYQDLSRLTPAR